jgi:glutathione synthase/RimK-type ligase-like ATP-grasp enzyme
MRLSSSKTAEAFHAAWEWSEALEGFLAHIPFQRWINHPTRNASASHKIEQLTRAKKAGFKTPDTLLTQNPGLAREFWNNHPTGIIVKPLASGYIERENASEDTLIYTNEVPLQELENDEVIRQCPTLFQERIRKSADLRVIYLDGRSVAVKLTAADSNDRQRLDIRRHNMRDVDYQTIKLQAQDADRIGGLVGSYELRFAALDFALDEQGNLVFFEINPNGQWAWLDLEAKTDIAALFVESLKGDA